MGKLPRMEITVETIGAQGDGIATTPEGRLYIPFAAPGDRLRVQPGVRVELERVGDEVLQFGQRLEPRVTAADEDECQ